MLRSLLFLLDRASKAAPLLRMAGPLAVLAVAGFAFWQLPSEPDVPSDPERAELTRGVCAQVSSALPPLETEHRTLVLPFENDDTQRVTATLRQVLRAGGGEYLPVEDDLLHQAQNKWLHLWGKTQQPVAIDDTSQAASRAQRVGAKYAIAGRVHQATRENLELDLALIDAENARQIYRNVFTNAPDKTGSPAVSTSDTGVMGSQHYILGVLAFALLWPLSLAAVTKKVLQAENNGLSLLALLVIAAVPIALAYPWAMVAHHTVWFTVGYLVGSLLVVLWCLFVMSKVAELVKY